ncbi:MAG TPA: ATP-binding protein [Casimicrobiaceae bacterium]|nr:ATP-binding protein [Casimicrobiaceae bacterium]
MTIRSHLILLAIGVVLPVFVFAIVVSVVLAAQDRHTIERAATERARAMMTAVDAELRGSITTLVAIAVSPALSNGDLRGFHDEAQRILGTQPAWLDVRLANAFGEIVVDAREPFGAAASRTYDPASVEPTLRTGHLVVGNVDQPAPSSPAAVPIRAPVLVNGRVVYVVTALVRPDSFRDIIRQQRLPDGWISGIVDANGMFVARIPPRPAGRPASPDFRAAVARAPEGFYRGFTAEGRDTFTAHESSPFSHWSIGLAIPADIVVGSAWRTSWLMGIGMAASVAIALGIAMLLGRRIAGPIVALASAARSVGAGTVYTRPVDGVREVNDVAAALREADVAVREREQLIEREKDALQAADRAKDEFIAALSHELRNPLAALTAAAHILRVADPTHTAAADARGVVDRQTRHMSRMIEDLLDVSRLIAGKTLLRMETFDLASLAEATIGAWRAADRFAGRCVIVAAQSAWVTADRTRMEQILANLLDNAVKFTSPGGTIAVGVSREGGSTLLTVADDGEGIASALVDRVFDVFVQGDQDVGRSKGGIGLGLTLVKRLAELQGGTVSASSGGVGCGTTFVVRMPEATASPPLIAAAVAPHAGTPRSIVIIEDNDDARDMLQQVLTMQGHVISESASGEAGAALVVEMQPDVAIVDIGLPDIDGYEVARRVRAQSKRRVALIALTGYGQPEDVRRAHAAGFDVHLVKPVSVDRLDAAIASVTGTSSTPLRAQ